MRALGRAVAVDRLADELQAIAAAATTPEDMLEPALRAIVESTGAVGGAMAFPTVNVIVIGVPAMAPPLV